jgi:hypothetical protein
VGGRGFLPVVEARKLHDALATRQGEFEDALTSLPARDREYFRTQAAALRKFLEMAIRLDEPIRANL